MNAHPEKLHKGKAVMMKLFINNYCQPDPAASPKAWMGACHYGGSRIIEEERNLLISGRVQRSPHLFSPFSNPPSCGASIGDAPRFMGVR
jgi:hypothetical protein